MNRFFIALVLGLLLTFNSSHMAYSQLGSLTSVSKIAQLSEYQSTELNHRTPLFLIHGIGGRESNHYRWESFLQYTQTHPEFQKRFKIYLFQYDTSQSVSDISQSIQKSLRAYISENNHPEFRVLAFSEGGLVYRNVMQDPVIYQHTEKVITVASPFQGSPLANQTWLRKQLKENTPFSLMRLTQKLSHAIAKKMHPNFEQDFHWDQTESSTPRVHQRYFALKNHNNFITYGSYFGVTPTYHEKLFQSLEVKEAPPKEPSRLKNLFSKHAVFRLVQRNLSAIPIQIKQKLAKKIRRQKSKRKSIASDTSAVTLMAVEETHYDNSSTDLPMLIYNDGISPISSSLWLNRYKNASKAQPWNALKSLKGKQKARLFHSIDHANWMEGHNLSKEAKLSDLLNPDEPSRTIFEWFIFDLTS